MVDTCVVTAISNSDGKGCATIESVLRQLYRPVASHFCWPCLQPLRSLSSSPITDSNDTDDKAVEEDNVDDIIPPGITQHVTFMESCLHGTEAYEAHAAATACWQGIRDA